MYYLKLLQQKIVQNLDDSVSEKETLKVFTRSFDTLANLNFSLITNSVVKIVKDDDDICVTNKKDIEDFLKNTTREDVKKIDELVATINKIGVKKEFTATCDNEECKHEWEEHIDFDPSIFFIDN